MKYPRIEVRELKKSFDETVILDQINFKVCLGESLVIIGASGSGKSVLTKCILGLLTKILNYLRAGQIILRV